MKTALVLFVYNRPEHTKTTIEALKLNPESKDLPLFIFSDQAKSQKDMEKVEAVRQFVSRVEGFNSVQLILRTENYGLFKNITSGIGEVFEAYEAVIVLEDDIVPAPNFLAFMLSGLRHYKDNQQVGSITGYNYPIEYPQSAEDGYFFGRFTCWGWGIWKDRWSTINWTPPQRDYLLKEKGTLKKLSKISNDLPELLLDLADGRNSSWSILVCLNHAEREWFCLHPFASKIENIGFDGTGVHSKIENQKVTRIDSSGKTIFIWPLEPDKGHCEAAAAYFKNSFQRKIKNLFTYGVYI